MNYFNIFTDHSFAINNINLYGYSDLDSNDICRLLGAHLKYSGGYKFLSKEEVYSKELLYKKELLPLKSILRCLDSLTLFQKVKKVTEVYDHQDIFYFDKLYHIYIDDEFDYYHIDLSGGDFKDLCKDRTAMIAENRRVGDAMKFLLSHNCEFEYDGSRAKLKMPAKHPTNKHLHVGSQISKEHPSDNRTFLRYDVYKAITEEKVIEILRNN